MLDRIFPQFALKRERARLGISMFKKQREALESLPTFARDNDEDSWLGLTTGDRQIKTEQGIEQMQIDALKASLTPHGRNAIDTMESFVIGKEAKISVIGFDDQKEADKKKIEAVQKYWDGFSKHNKFDKRSKELLRRTIRDGENFLRWFVPETDAEMVEGSFQKIRFVEPNEIKDHTGEFTYGIETDPADIEKVISYRREFNKKVTTDDLTRTIDHEEIPADEMMHTKILVDSNVKRGLSFLIGVAEFMTKHVSWLNDRITLNKMRSIFNIIGEVEGSGSIGGITDQFSDVTGKTASGGTSKKKLPKSGTVLFTRGVKYKYDNLNIRAQDTKDDGRAIQLMIALGLQFPEYIATGDASNSNFASTMVSESPFVRMIEKYQDIFASVFKEIFIKAIEFGVTSNQIEGVTEADLDIISCQVDFDTLIHRDLDKETKSYSLQKSDGVMSRKTYSGKLGLDFDDEQKQIATEGDLEDENELERERKFNQNPNERDKNNKNRE